MITQPTGSRLARVRPVNRLQPVRWLRWLAAGSAAAVLALAGCGAGPVVPDPPASPSASASRASVPTGGISLRDLGFDNGPAQLSLPVGVVLTTSADQVQQVTLVISSPPPKDVSDYLLRVLPTTGFTVGRHRDDAIEFSGHGWIGSFVATGAVCAVTLQPVS